MRLRLGAAALALAAGAALTGCGGDGGDTGSSGGGSGGQDAPRNASIEEFCATFEEASGLVAGDEAADKLAKTGTPAEIPEDARRGFEYLIDHPEGGQDVIDNEDIGAYVTYGSKTCADLINDQG